MPSRTAFARAWKGPAGGAIASVGGCTGPGVGPRGLEARELPERSDLPSLVLVLLLDVSRESASMRRSPPSAESGGRTVARTRAFFPPKPNSPRLASARISISTRSRPTCRAFRALSIASSIVSPSVSVDFMASSLRCSHDGVLLTGGEQIVHQPVEHETRREVDEHEGEHQRHDHHHPLLGGI